MPTVIKRRVVDDGLIDFIRVHVNFPVGLVDPPDEVVGTTPPSQYAILSPILGGYLYGPPLAAPEQDAELAYQVRGVGADRRQAQWVADEIRRVWCGRVVGDGNLSYELEVPEHTVTDRGQTGPIGAPELLSGLYQVVETYYLKVSRDA